MQSIKILDTLYVKSFSMLLGVNSWANRILQSRAWLISEVQRLNSLLEVSERDILRQSEAIHLQWKMMQEKNGEIEVLESRLEDDDVM